MKHRVLLGQYTLEEIGRSNLVRHLAFDEHHEVAQLSVIDLLDEFELAAVVASAAGRAFDLGLALCSHCSCDCASVNESRCDDAQRKQDRLFHQKRSAACAPKK